MAEDIFQTMSTVAEIRIVGGNEAKALSAAKAVILDIEKRFNIFDPKSELSQLCQNYHPKIPFLLNSDLFEILSAADAVNKLAGGLFNVCWTGDLKPSCYQLDPKTKTVTFLQSNLKINLGAIAKGYAADLALASAKKFGGKKILISLGGHINVFSQEDPWKLGLQDPEQNFGGILGTLKLSDGSFSTSAENYRGQHIINPLDKHWKSKYGCVSILHQKGIFADALSTAFFLSSEKQIVNLVKKFNLNAIIIKDKKICLTEKMLEIFAAKNSIYTIEVIK